MVGLTLKSKMEKDFEPGDSANLPRVDCFTAAAYLASMDKISPHNNAKKDCSGDDAIGYVQLCRNEDLCTLKAMVCPQPKIHANVTLTLNEIDEEILKTECHVCEGLQNGCMHGASFVLWLHRRSEEPDFRHRESYWRKPKIAEVDSEPKFITVKQLAGTKHRLPEIESNPAVLRDFLAEAKKRNLDGPLIRYLSAKEDEDNS